MLTTKRFVKKYGTNVCRYCIMDETGVVDLDRRDCVYAQGTWKCPRCQRPRHIVTGFKWSGIRKLILK